MCATVTSVPRNIDTEPFQLERVPVDDEPDIGSVRRASRVVDLASEPFAPFVQRHRVPTEGSDASRLESGGTATGDEHPLRVGRSFDLVVTQSELATCANVDDAPDSRRNLPDPGEAAVVAADTRPHLGGTALARFLRQVRVGNERSHHRDEIRLSGRDDLLGFIQIHDPACDHRRHLKLRTYFRGDRELMHVGLLHRGNDNVSKSPPSAKREVDVVDLARRFDGLGDLAHIVGRKATVNTVFAVQSDPDPRTRLPLRLAPRR